MQSASSQCASSENLAIVLRSRFEGIHDLRTGVELGVEALLRAQYGRFTLSPALLFSAASPLGSPLQADRLARDVHLRNHASRGLERPRLFLNVLPETALADGVNCIALRKLMEDQGVAPSEVIIEISERPHGDLRGLRRAIAAYRDLGCGIALDDVGAKGREDTRLAEIIPDVVKLDRYWLASGHPPDACAWLRRGIQRARDAGALICAEGIETQIELERAIHLGADCGQGYGLPQLLRRTWSAAARYLKERRMCA